MRKIADLLNAAKKMTSTSVNKATAAIVALAMLGTVAGVSATAMAQDENAAEAQTQTAQTTDAQDAQSTDTQDAQADTTQADASTAQSDDSAAADANASGDTGSTVAANDGVSAAAANVGTVAGSTPSNTTMDLFDYWLTGQNDQDNNDNVANTLNQGINAGHDLKFMRKSWGTEGGNSGTSPATNPSLNAWTGKITDRQGGPFTGIVENNLDANGYPVLKAGNLYEGQQTGEDDGGRIRTNTSARTTRQSLSYLFNPTECGAVSGCAAYTGVKGLLQDDNGMYSYNSQDNFASFNKDTNSFTLYDKGAVGVDSTAVADQSTGQFFPFNDADDVFDSNGDSAVNSNSPVLKHYFGLHMKSTFTQPANGTVDGQPMVFNFSGDDDVWVFIDGKLVGDVGGVHDRLTLSINFKSGAVQVKNGASYGDSSHVFTSTTIGEALRLNSDTLPSGTEHTLDFFYMERGNGNSNMMLGTNLVYHPANEMLKIDQAGNPISDVTFNLYEADADGKKTNQTPVASGTTDNNGSFTFTNSADSTKLLTLTELYADGAHPDYVLEEENTPDGYRKPTAMHIKLQEDKNGHIYATSANKFETGAIATPRVQTTITSDTITGEREGQTVKNTITDAMMNNGKIVAVAMRFNSSQQCPDGSTGVDRWQAVVGDAENGWLENGTGFDGVLKAAQQNYKNHGENYNAFAKNENGQWSADIQDLPGELGEYYYAAVNDADVNYAIGYFYIPNTVLQNENSTDTSGMYRLDSVNYDRMYASVIQVPNIKNVLVVQKTDVNGNPIEANDGDNTTANDVEATFELYQDNNGVPAANPYSTKTTTDQKVADGRLGLAGAVSFPDNKSAANGKDTAVLKNGTYWVRESAAPKGYKLNEHWTKVIVSDSGVYADATAYTATKGADGNITAMTQVATGTKDNISVNVGLGTLVRTMTQWAGDGGDDPLQYVTGTLKTGTESNGSISWNAASDDDQRIKYEYGFNGGTTDTDTSGIPLLKYGYFSVGDRGQALKPQSLANTTFSVDDGYADVTVKPTNPSATYTNLDATPLLTGSTIIRVADESTSAQVDLTFYKQVAGANWAGKTADDQAQNFAFTLKRTDDKAGKVTYPKSATGGTTVATELAKGGTVAASTTGEIKQGADSKQLIGAEETGVKYGSKSTNTLPQLTFNADGEYTFTLTENSTGKVAGWKYDETSHAVKVTVEDCATACTYTVQYDGQTAAPTFTNSYVAVSALPLTGGMSARNWLIIGGLAVIAAGVIAMIVNEYRKRNSMML